MLPTRAQIKTRFRRLLNDPNGRQFTDDLFTEAFSEAYDALFNAFLNAQCPRITVIATWTVTPGTVSLTPVQMGLTDFADIDWMRERTFGSQEKFQEVHAVDELDQRTPSDRLLEYRWAFDTFWFIGATTTREIQIEYESSGTAPTNDDATINVDGSLTFLAKAAAAVAGPLKGLDELAALYRVQAYGPKYDAGVIGGELFRLVQPRVRSRQHVQIAPKPYSSTRRLLVRRAVPYVAAQQGTTGGGDPNVPVQFSTADGSITPLPDGVKTVFWAIYNMAGGFRLYRNGARLTEDLDYTRLSNQFTFLDGPNIPQEGDVISAEGYRQ